MYGYTVRQEEHYDSDECTEKTSLIRDSHQCMRDVAKYSDTVFDARDHSDSISDTEYVANALNNSHLKINSIVSSK